VFQGQLSLTIDLVIFKIRGFDTGLDAERSASNRVSIGSLDQVLLEIPFCAVSGVLCTLESIWYVSKVRASRSLRRTAFQLLSVGASGRLK
jgi:hypothetical protein